MTGAENHGQLPLNHLIDKLREYNAAPALQGFGISEPEQVKISLAAGAAGAISGSAIVKIIENNVSQPAEMLAQLANFVTNMKAATRS
ncbi:tryptophan synthase subunit alpha [Yersinia enterocolitica]|nr:tryptophan synthase subunit alpha [Yersinia enterocolitica]CQI15601.1 tryptophan synthase subunit alpha [Yersinia enterocolitica]CQJ41063.1 tryptophan synthase subunit alpha [Yersinia enterocolitica]CRX54436.1 tryptophan synthase subunit alpha [Yersinia enterocolitica]